MWFADKLGPAQRVNGMPEQLVIHENLIGDQPQDVPLQNSGPTPNNAPSSAAKTPDEKKKKGWF